MAHRNGAIEWLAWPRFDSPSCFAALLGDKCHRHWTVQPTAPFRTTQRYRQGSAECFGYDGDVAQWKAVRQAIHDEVCAKGFDSRLNTLTRAYGTGTLDAALLIPLVGFLEPDDPRVLATTKAIERDLKMLPGNMPQALTHLSPVHTAFNLEGEGPAHTRSQSRHSQSRQGRTDHAP